VRPEWLEYPGPLRIHFYPGGDQWTRSTVQFHYPFRPVRSQQVLAAQSIISKVSSAQAAIIRSHAAQASSRKAKAGASGITKSVRGDSEF